MIDLHTHTLLSDGELLPSELVRRAVVAGYTAIALTDHVDISNIDFVLPRIVKVAQNLSRHWPIKVIPGVEITHAPLEEIEAIQTDLLIQTTPLGMFPSTEECTILPEMLREGMVVMDVVYNPPETKLLKMAREQGCLTVNGLTMFVYQGAEQFRLWTGCEAPVTAMRVALKEALGGAT